MKKKKDLNKKEKKDMIICKKCNNVIYVPKDSRICPKCNDVLINI